MYCLYKFISWKQLHQSESYVNIGENPDVLVIQVMDAGDCIINGFTTDGGFCGDSWLPSLEEAFKAICLWYNVSADDWTKFECDPSDPWECLKQAVTLKRNGA